MAAGERALRSAFERVVLVTRDARGALRPVDGLAQPVLESLALRHRGGGGDRARHRPLAGDRCLGRAARCARPCDRRRAHRAGAAADEVGREHATALASVLAQGLWRLRAAEAELRAQAGLQRQELQSTFLAAVSHDLRTPLAAIVAAASSLQDQRERLTVRRAGTHAGKHRRQARFSPESPRTRCSWSASPRADPRVSSGSRSRKSSAASSARRAIEPCGARIAAHVS